MSESGKGSAWRAGPGLPRYVTTCNRPTFWLIVGLLASLAYGHVGFVFPEFIASLPYPFFPVQGVILAVLLMTPARAWWKYLALYYAVQVLDGIWLSSLPAWYLLASNVANVIEPLIGAMLLSHFMSLPPRFNYLREAGIYIACVAVASAIGATWGTTVRVIAGFDFWSSLRGWFLADVLASLVLTPTILLCSTWCGQPRGPGSDRRALEGTLLLLCLIGVEAFAFGLRGAAPTTAPTLLYLPVPFLVWAAVRFGPLGLSLSLTITTLLAIVGVVNRLGPFADQPVSDSVFLLQIFLLGVGMPLFCLAALVKEHTEARASLQESEARYRAVVSNFPQGIVLLFGRDLRHHVADGRALPELSLTGEPIVGRTPAEVFPPNVAAELSPRYLAALAGQDSVFDLVHHGRTYQARMLPISLAETTVGMAVMQDVTELRRADELARLGRAKTAFFSNVSHEFRTPLTLLLGPLQEVLSAPPDALAPETLAQLETAHRNGLRLLKLVNTLLDVSRLEAGEFQAVFQPTDLAEYTADLASMFRPVIEQAGLRLIVDCPPLPEPVYVDRDQWEHIVFNLLSNATKFTFSGEVAVALDVDEGHAVLRVRDTGVGIAPDEILHIFERFHQANRTGGRTFEGSGIGLALVQELVKLHGGTVRVISTPGLGSTFAVSIPLGTAHLPDEQLGPDSAALTGGFARASLYTEEARSWLGNEPARDGQARLLQHGSPGTVVVPQVLRTTPPLVGPARPTVRILVADDNADMRAYLVHVLGRYGIVQVVSDGAVALDAIRSWEPDLVVADVMMPGLDGFGLLRAVRTDPEVSTVPIIMLSARAGEEARVEGLQAGADDYLVKPFAAAELVARVQAQLQLGDLRRKAWMAAGRRRLAFDLHDSVTQSLYALTVLAEAGRRASASGNRMLVDDCLERMGDSARQALRDLRLLVWEHRPSALASLGLVRALDQRLDAVERRAGIDAQLDADGDLVLSPDAEVALYHIAQEALNNSFKHAAASAVLVRISDRGRRVTLHVCDNGRGIDPSALAGGEGVGLTSMRERAAHLGASVAIGRQRRGGTRVTVRLRTNGQPSAAVLPEAGPS